MQTNWLLCFAIAIIPIFFSLATKAQEQPPIRVATDTGLVDFEEWKQHLADKMAPYVKKAAKKMKACAYTIDVRVLIEKDGSVNDVKALNDPGCDLGKAAEKVVKGGSNGPRWIAVEFYPNKIRSYHTVPITFSITK